MVNYGSIPTINVTNSEGTPTTPQTLIAPSFPREHRDVRTPATILATIIVSSLLFVMIRFPLQTVASLRERVASNLEGAITNLSNHGSDHSDNRMNYQVPFPEVDRADYNDPVSGFVKKELFHPSLVSTSSHHDFPFPFPTGAFWTNLVLHPTADRSLSYPVAVYPYAYKWSPSLLQVSYPAAHRKEEPKMIHDYFFPDLTLSARSNDETEDEMTRHIMAFDPLSVTLRFHNTGASSSYWETYLVQGSPYVTVRYQQTVPKIHALSIFRDITCPQQQDGSINTNEDGDDSVCEYTTETTNSDMSKVLTGVQFVVQTQEGMEWLIVASKKITLVFDQITRTTMVSKYLFDGVLRIAHIPSVVDASTTQSKDKSSGVSKLVQHAATYPTGGQVRWSFRSGGTAKSSRIGTVQFVYTTQSFSPSSSSSSSSPPEILMLALPHHAENLPKSNLLDNDDFDLEYNCIKGPMTAVLGATWAYDELLPALGFDGDKGSNSMESLSDSNVRSAIIKSLKEDSMLALPTLMENVYGFGKQSARLAQLCHICNKLLLHAPQGNQDNETTDLESLLAHLIDLLSSSLESFLSGKVKDFLVYDTNLGGIVSSDGLLNTEADFGNGRYNDHHFHYGYLFYACAVLGSLNQTFIERYGDLVDAVYFDIAYDANSNSSSSDGVFFPFTRHKVWFDGHSFASGMFPFGNGKSQESSSEAVNCYYGAYLWSLVRNGHGFHPESDTSSGTDFARLLLATEIRGAKSYWHTKASIYPSQFAKNLMVGNLGMLDAICSTWFGTDPLYVHMINFIPVTSVTGDLFSKDFVSEEITYAMRPVENVEMAWRGYVVADTAILDPNKAWKEAQNLFSPELDSGLSKSQVLYWIATRDGFDTSKLLVDTSTTSVTEAGISESDTTGTSSGGGLCQQNIVCAKLGLTGQCCPTLDGIFLGCCS
eukprot:scaffold982_cov169-Amphora_coffeaeformis.AAC.9